MRREAFRSKLVSESALANRDGAINASDLAKILFKTEVPEIATEIANLSSPDVVDDEELKN